MVTDASSHEAEDKKRREVIEQRNKAENLAYQMEKLLKDNAGKISEPTAKLVQDGIAEVQKIKASEDLEAIKAAVEKLEQASHKAAEELYRAPPPRQPNGGPGPAPLGAQRGRPARGQRGAAPVRRSGRRRVPPGVAPPPHVAAKRIVTEESPASARILLPIEAGEGGTEVDPSRKAFSPTARTLGAAAIPWAAAYRRGSSRLKRAQFGQDRLVRLLLWIGDSSTELPCQSSPPSSSPRTSAPPPLVLQGREPEG